MFINNAPLIRSLTCNHCLYQGEADEIEGGLTKTCRCKITKRIGSVRRGYYCQHFVNRTKESSDKKFNGYKVRSKQIEDYRTKNQWRQAGYAVKKDATGTEMYAVMLSAQNDGKRFVYYLPEEVEKIER